MHFPPLELTLEQQLALAKSRIVLKHLGPEQLREKLLDLMKESCIKDNQIKYLLKSD